MLSALIVIGTIMLLVGTVIGWLVRGADNAHKLVDGCHERAERTRAILPKPVPGREQFLRDLRGEGAKRDGSWWSRRRRDHEARNRRRA